MNYESFRIRENVQTRNKKKRPTHLSMRLMEGGVESIHSLPKEAVIATMPIFRFHPPGYLLDPTKKEAGWVGAKFKLKTDAPRTPEAWKAYKAPQFFHHSSA